MCDVDFLSIDQVQTPEQLSRYIQQQTGTPWPTLKDMILLKKKCKEFFEHYPHCTYATLCRVADWAHRKRKRYSHVWKVVDAFRYAYEDGALPEVDNPPSNDSLDDRISEALELETDRIWCMKLSATSNRDTRKEVLQSWYAEREPQLRRLAPV